MKYVDITDKMELDEFVTKAVDHFNRNPNSITYTNARIEAGVLFAMRWGHDGKSMLVFRIDERFEPTVFGEALGRYIILEE